MRSIVAKRIQETREAKRLSRSELAEKLGITRLQLWRLETGVTEVSADDVPRIADALGTSVSNLYRAKAS